MILNLVLDLHFISYVRLHIMCNGIYFEFLNFIKVDKLPEVMTISSNGFWHLSLPENVFLGGVNHEDKLPLDLKSKAFFVGCIQKVFKSIQFIYSNLVTPPLKAK